MVSEFPHEFEADFYRLCNPDLAHMSCVEALSHFNSHGRQEGRQASKADTRDGFLSCLPMTGRRLEIGPFFAPVIDGVGAEYADVLDTADLVARAARLSLPTEGIPKIDYVCPYGGDLSAIPSGFDLVFSSHTLEHQPDLVRHLRQVEALLARGGIYAVILPDRRYCFDALLPDSTVADVVEAHLQRLTRHAPRSVLRHMTLTTHNDTDRHWAGDHREPLDYAERLRSAVRACEKGDDDYTDVHAWQFTPKSFRAVVDLLFEASITRLRALRVYNTPRGSLEFCAILGR